MLKTVYYKVRHNIVEFIKDGTSWLRYKDNNNKFHYVKAYDSPDGGGGDDIQLKTINNESLKGTGNISITTDVPVVVVSGTTPTQALAPNTFYKFGTVTSLTLTQQLPVYGIINIYAYSFTAGENFDATTAIPAGVTLDRELEIEEGQFCEVSIQDSHATYKVWPAPEVESPEAPGKPVVDG